MEEGTGRFEESKEHCFLEMSEEQHPCSPPKGLSEQDLSKGDISRRDKKRERSGGLDPRRRSTGS